MIKQLNPPLPLKTTKGHALAHFMIDYGPESDLYWVCFLDKNGECWVLNNKEIRATKNETLGRNHISPFYDPSSVSLKKKSEPGWEPI